MQMTLESINESDDLAEEDWDADMIEEMIQKSEPLDFSSLVVYSRDWTIETNITKLRKGI